MSTKHNCLWTRRDATSFQRQVICLHTLCVKLLWHDYNQSEMPSNEIPQWAGLHSSTGNKTKKWLTKSPVTVRFVEKLRFTYNSMLLVLVVTSSCPVWLEHSVKPHLHWQVTELLISYRCLSPGVCNFP